MKWILLVVAVIAELFLWFSLGYTYDSVERLFEQIVFYSGIVIIAFALFVPALEASDESHGSISSEGNLERYSQYALIVFILAALLGAVLGATLINLFTDIFVTGDYFYAR